MVWIAPCEKATDNAELEKRLWDAVEQALRAAHVAAAEYHGARPGGLLGFTEVRFAAPRAGLKALQHGPDQINL